MRMRPHNRARTRGAAMVESIVMISMFILFFMGMVYFRSMYQQKLRVQRLARAAAVSYALAACNGDPMASIQADLGSASNNNSGQQQGTANLGGMNPNPSGVGSNAGSSNSPTASALSGQGMAGDPIAGINVQAPAAGTTKSRFGTTVGLRSTVSSNAYMSCGENQQDGNVGGALQYIKGEISGSGF
jgi:hypothetical protein